MMSNICVVLQCFIASRQNIGYNTQMIFGHRQLCVVIRVTKFIFYDSANFWF
jgi:hypothetical protein